MILAAVWSALSAVALLFNWSGLRDALCDLELLEASENGAPRDRRTLVAAAHIREEMVGVAAQAAFLFVGVLRLLLGPPQNERVSFYRAATTALFLLVQLALVANAVARRRYRRRLIAAKERMLADEASRLAP